MADTRMRTGNVHREIDRVWLLVEHCLPACLPSFRKAHTINMIAFHVSITDQQTRTATYKYVNILSAVTQVRTVQTKRAFFVSVTAERSCSLRSPAAPVHDVAGATRITADEVQSEDYKYTPDQRGCSCHLPFGELPPCDTTAQNCHPLAYCKYTTDALFAVLHI
jgi:hypothetical protein